MIKKYSNKPWKWYFISANPNITMEIIEKYPDKPWNWQYISLNPNITMGIIEKYPDKVNQSIQLSDIFNECQGFLNESRSPVSSMNMASLRESLAI